jgi:hypothetical protein
MRHDVEPDDGFSAEGDIIEIFQQDGARRAKVFLAAGAIVEIAVPEATDLHLGDTVVLGGAAGVTIRSRSLSQNR